MSVHRCRESHVDPRKIGGMGGSGLLVGSRVQEGESGGIRSFGSINRRRVSTLS